MVLLFCNLSDHKNDIILLDRQKTGLNLRMEKIKAINVY